MKVKKILFTIFVFLLGMCIISAEDSTATTDQSQGSSPSCSRSDYEFAQQLYLKVSIVSYYDSLAADIDGVDQNALAVITSDTDITNNSYYDDMDINNLITTYVGTGTPYKSIRGLIRALFDGTTRYDTDANCPVLHNLKNSSTINTTADLWSEVRSATASIAGTLDPAPDPSFEEWENSVAISFSGLCDYLNAHQGLSNFLIDILNIVTYAALALGIFLGVLDFIKAIASQEDAALTKAFQTFIKRVAAIALLFLAGFFVNMIANLVYIPGVDPENIVCSQFNLGIGGANSNEG